MAAMHFIAKELGDTDDAFYESLAELTIKQIEAYLAKVAKMDEYE